MPVVRLGSFCRRGTRERVRGCENTDAEAAAARNKEGHDEQIDTNVKQGREGKRSETSPRLTAYTGIDPVSGGEEELDVHKGTRKPVECCNKAGALFFRSNHSILSVTQVDRLMCMFIARLSFDTVFYNFIYKFNFPPQ